MSQGRKGEGKEMIASWIMKRMIDSTFDKAGEKGDAESAIAKVTDDYVNDFGIDVSVGGTVTGKKATIDWYHKWYEQFPKRKLIAKNISFAAYPLCPKNVVMMEWTCEETDKEGKQYKYDGATVTEMKNGKVVRSTEYIACKGLPQLSDLIKPVGKA
jgi:hypothetical protein